ncbi:hypothetical protein D9M68_652110 [compost metagenome]
MHGAAGSPDLDLGVSARGHYVHQAPAGIRPGSDFLAVDGQDAVAGQQSGARGRRVGRGLGNDGHRLFGAGHVQAGIKEDREDQVENGARRDDGDALADRFSVEGARGLLGAGAGGRVILHLDVAAQRQRGNRPFRAVPVGAAQDDLAEPHRETQDFHAAQASHPVVPQLMEDDQGAKRNRKGQQGEKHRIRKI